MAEVVELAYITVVETRSFIEDAAGCFTEEERTEFIEYIARNPTAGVVVPGAGGVRKVRWRARGRGKRGGARVVYFFHNERVPLFLLAAYAKSQRVDLAPAQRTAMRRIAAEIVKQYAAVPAPHRTRRPNE